MEQMEQSSHYSSGTGHRTHSLPSTFSTYIHCQVVLQVGGETSKKRTRTCTVPQIVPRSYCLLLQYSCSVIKDTQC